MNLNAIRIILDPFLRLLLLLLICLGLMLCTNLDLNIVLMMNKIIYFIFNINIPFELNKQYY